MTCLYLVLGRGVGASRGRRCSSASVPPEPELEPRAEPLELSDHASSDML